MPSGRTEEGESEPSARPLHLLTTDILLADLISGRSITTSEGHSLSLTTDHSRAALNWYRRNRTKWAGNVMTADCEALIDSIASTPPELPAPAAVGASDIKHSSWFDLKRIVLRACMPAPTDFVFEPDKQITLFEGWNGSGKTSLANAIIWCLTGQLKLARATSMICFRKWSGLKS